MISEEELQKLADDIKANGLLEPVVLYHGEVLDGRNRLAACRLAGIEPRFTHVDELPSLVSYVRSKNLHRRHLTVGQKAVIAVEMIPLLTEEARKRETTGKKIDPTANAQQGPPVKGTAASIAGGAVGVRERAVFEAQAVKRADLEKFEQVKRGEMSLATAYKQVPHAPNGQNQSESWNGVNGRAKGSKGVRDNRTAPYDPSTPRRKQLAEAQKKKMIVGLSTIRGLHCGLSELDIMMAISVCSPKEIETWSNECRESAKALRAFGEKLRKGTQQ